jgi:hypothetical protein
MKLEDQTEIQFVESYEKPNEPSDDANELDMFFHEPLLEE